MPPKKRPYKCRKCNEPRQNCKGKCIVIQYKTQSVPLVVEPPQPEPPESTTTQSSTDNGYTKKKKQYTCNKQRVIEQLKLKEEETLKSIREMFECSICTEVIGDYQILGCANCPMNYCSDCRQEMLRTKKYHCSQCGIGYAPGKKRGWVLESLVDIYGLTFPCENKDRGCDIQLTRSELADHQYTCVHSPLKCLSDKCTCTFSKWKDLKEHLHECLNLPEVLSSPIGYFPISNHTSRSSVYKNFLLEHNRTENGGMSFLVIQLNDEPLCSYELSFLAFDDNTLLKKIWCRRACSYRQRTSLSVKKSHNVIGVNIDNDTVSELKKQTSPNGFVVGFEFL